MLLTYDEKLAELSRQGVQLVVEEPFSREFSLRSAEDFFEQTLRQGLEAKAVVVGYDFAFGRERQGSLDRLREWCGHSGIELEVVSPVEFDGKPVSSSRIRELYLAGDVKAGNELLSRPFSYTGLVIRGNALGRGLGFPTANITPEPEKLMLPYGVYATQVRIGDTVHPGATNWGVRPTIVQNQPVPLVEAHVMGYSGDLYGKRIEVRFIERLRGEEKFGSLDALKAQIQLDCLRSMEILLKFKPPSS